MAPSIPNRWLDYKPVGEIIEGTRFIAFKVPLKDHIVQCVPADVYLSCNSLLDEIPNLGLIIDLTNTYRYYDPSFFQKEGIAYNKLMIPGLEVPPSYLVQKFNKLVKDFLQENANNIKLIGVHCTHGVNRTGYLISNYMISELKINPQEAIKCFEEARGHAIERQNYRNHLLGVTIPWNRAESDNHNNPRNNSNTSSPELKRRKGCQTVSNNYSVNNWRSNSNDMAPYPTSSGRRISPNRGRYERRNSFDRYTVTNGRSDSNNVAHSSLSERTYDISTKKNSRNEERDERRYSENFSDRYNVTNWRSDSNNVTPSPLGKRQRRNSRNGEMDERRYSDNFSDRYNVTNWRSDSSNVASSPFGESTRRNSRNGERDERRYSKNSSDRYNVTNWRSDSNNVEPSPFGKRQRRNSRNGERDERRYSDNFSDRYNVTNWRSDSSNVASPFGESTRRNSRNGEKDERRYSENSSDRYNVTNWRSDSDNVAPSPFPESTRRSSRNGETNE